MAINGLKVDYCIFHNPEIIWLFQGVWADLGNENLDFIPDQSRQFLSLLKPTILVKDWVEPKTPPYMVKHILVSLVVEYFL